MIILIVVGINILMERFKQTLPWLSFVIMILFLGPPGRTAAEHLRHGWEHQNNKDVMTVLKTHYQPGDMIFLNNEAQYPFLYYAKRLDFQDKISRISIPVLNEKRFNGLQVGLFLDDLSMNNGKKFIKLKRHIFCFNEDKFSGEVMVGEDIDRFYEIHTTIDDTFGRQPREWLVFSNIEPRAEEFILKVFDQRAKRTLQMQAKDASIYLYELLK